MEKFDNTPKIKKIDRDVFFTTFGNNSRLELKNSMFGRGKLAILLQKFDDNNKQTAALTLYIDLPKALVMANDILSGKYASTAQKSGQSFTKVFEDMGGQPAERAKRADGKPLYRAFSIQKGEKWIFRGVSGPGKITKTGGFAPDGESEVVVSVGMDSETLKAVALMIQAEYQAYRTVQMSKCATEPEY